MSFALGTGQSRELKERNGKIARSQVNFFFPTKDWHPAFSRLVVGSANKSGDSTRDPIGPLRPLEVNASILCKGYLCTTI